MRDAEGALVAAQAEGRPNTDVLPAVIEAHERTDQV